MRRDDTEKLTRRDYLRVLPELWEMAYVAGDQVVRASRIGTFNKDVIVSIFRHQWESRGPDEVRVILEELEQLLPKAAANHQLRPREHFLIFHQDRF